MIVSGRPFWLSRDPIGEFGGSNLYGMVENDPVNQVDYLGLWVHPNGIVSPEETVSTVEALETQHLEVLREKLSSVKPDRGGLKKITWECFVGSDFS